MPASHLALILAICLAWGGNFLASAIALSKDNLKLRLAYSTVSQLSCASKYLAAPDHEANSA